MSHLTQTGAEAIVDQLIANGVDTVFGIPGVQTYALFDAFNRAGDKIRVIGARHEQTAAYMAYGYAKSTGRIGVYSVVPGPGVLNTTAAMCTAYGTSAPVLCLTGQVPSDFIGSGKGHVHELPDQLGVLQRLTKWAARLDHPSRAPEIFATAFRQLSQGRRRPVAIETPWDVFSQHGAVAPAEPAPAPPEAGADLHSLQRAAELLATARQPMIMVGSGAQHAAAEVHELAEFLQAPVVALRGGKGVVSDDSPLAFNCASGFKLWPDTDLVIGIGSRLELKWFRWQSAPSRAKLINIDIDPEQMYRLKADVPVLGDAKLAVRQLLDELRARQSPRPSQIERYRRIGEDSRAEVAALGLHVDYLDAIRRAMPRDGIFVEEVCQSGFTSYFAYPVYAPRTYITGGYQCNLGYGFPTALGVKVGNPDKPVLSVTGDGGFMFAIQELATAKQYGIDLITVVFNNSVFGNVLRDQEALFEGRTIGAELVNPDFMRLAASFGIAGMRAGNPGELQQCIRQAIALRTPVVIEVPVDRSREKSPWPFLMPEFRQAA